MEASYALRTTPWREACPVAPALCEPVLPRLDTLMKPFVTVCHGEAATPHATRSVCGLLSAVACQNIASMAERLGPSRLPLHGCMGWDAWDKAPWREEVRGQGKTPVDQAMGWWGALLLACPRPVRRRWGWPGSGVGAWAKARPAA